MPNLPESEERHVRDYVTSQEPDDLVTLVQKVGSRRILTRVHEMYDVHCERSRWWVITDPTNLYSQTDFPEVEQALIFHLGLGLYMAQQNQTDFDEEEEVSGAWRRHEQAIAAMDSASEAEDFQAVGIKCREALLALVHDIADAAEVGELPDAPKGSDFKGWGNLLAERLADGRMRAYMKALVDKTWDLAVWLQHYPDATPSDADLVLFATAHIFRSFAILVRRQRSGPPERCPKCGSYSLEEVVDVVEDPESGFLTTRACRACDWRSDASFTSWEEHFKDSDIEGYLRRTGGPSDRLHRGE
jgi:hypothetical protein